jgi:dUTP pyrophosphatase
MVKCEKCSFEYESEIGHLCLGNKVASWQTVSSNLSWDGRITFASRIRGFEKVSEEQWNKDNPEIESFFYEEIKLPKRATRGSGGYDFFAPYTFSLSPGGEIKVCTGIKAYMLMDEKLEISPRSGLGFKYYLRLANTIGKVDSDYFNNSDTEGHIYIKVRNEGDKNIFIEKGSAFAQGSFEKYLLVDGDSFSDGELRVGGTGSTG